MLLGIVTDIHDRVGNLRQALGRFDRAGVEQVVCLGDAIDTFTPGEAGVEVCRLLSDAGAVGVWGNHDAGASLLLSERIQRLADPEVLAYAATLHPQVVLGNARFSHVETWLNPRELMQLWFFDGPPDTVEKARRSFDAASERYLFMGHFHRWLVMTRKGPLEWDAGGSLALTEASQYLIVVAAVVDGWCALFDTDTGELVPVRCLA